MKKISNINLSGRVIPIEDAAYEKLQQYIESLRRYFRHEEGRDEIINDIESRMAELMSDKIRKGTSAITEADVEELVSAMGRVEDFEEADKDSATAGNANTTQPEPSSYVRRERGRMYRDSGNRIVGGVCSGIANYTGVDPSVIRFLFIILGLATGLGILAYIILWIVLPPKDLEGFSGKKLYRNPDNKVFGGVAGGLSAYFKIKASTIRLILAAPLMLNILLSVLNRFRYDHDFSFALNLGFGSITGMFILTYIILWIILPEAESDYQKMEMRGETVDINRIRQNVREGMGHLKEKMKDWGQEVKDSAQQMGSKAKEFASTQGKAFAAEVQDAARRGGRGLGHAIAVLFKVFFIFIAGIIAFSIFMTLLALIFGGVAWWPINNFLWTSNWQQVLAWLTLILFLLVPMVGFIVWLVRRLMKVKSKNNHLGWIFGGLWALGWLAMILFVSGVVRDFRHFEQAESTVAMDRFSGNKMIVTVMQPELEYNGRFGWINDPGNGWDMTADSMKIAAVKFSVKPSIDSQYHVVVKKYGFGSSIPEAAARAEKTVFQVRAADSLLDVDNSYAIGKESKFRFQHVELEIRVPVGKTIRFDPSVKEKLHSIHTNIKKGYRRNRITGIEFRVHDEDRFEYEPGVDYQMGADGLLQGPGGTKPYDGYRYEKEVTPAKDDSIRLQIEQEKKKKEESERKIRELENLQKKSGTGILRNNDIPGGSHATVLAGGPFIDAGAPLWF